MPNFVVRDLKGRKYPFGGHSAEFCWEANSAGESLIFTRLAQSEFFLVVKRRENDYLVKSDKLTRPSNLAILQKALSEFMRENTLNLVSCAINLAEPKSLERTPFLIGADEFGELASKSERIYVEIGFGSGRHLLFQAKNNPDILIVGIEVYKPAIAQVSNLISATGLKNVVLLNLDARLALSLVPNEKIDKIFLHFPIPWKSLKRRVVSEQFASECLRTLKLGASFELRSDEREYADFTSGIFLDLNPARVEIFKNRFLGVSSKYEDRWIHQNKDIYDVIFYKEKSEEFARIQGEFSFDGLNLTNLRPDLAPRTHKGDDFFVHIQRIYTKNGGEFVVKATFGSFFRPQHAYILIAREKSEYLFKKPLKTRENLRAHEILKEFLFCQKS